MIKVKLLTNGGYKDAGTAIVGEVVEAVAGRRDSDNIILGYDVTVAELKRYGFIGDDSVADTDTLHFSVSSYGIECEVVDG